MTVGSSRIGVALKRRMQTSVGKRFSRFIVVAAGAVVASQITLTVCLGPVGWTAGRSAVAAWLVGAAVSYVLSRWAWERKGKPNLLKETLPFWIVAVGTAVVLTAHYQVGQPGGHRDGPQPPPAGAVRRSSPTSWRTA